MTSSISDPWSFAVSFIELAFDETILASGSSFFWSCSGRVFLITNWHNLSGRNPDTGQPMSPHGGVPNNLTFMAYRRESSPNSEGFFNMSIVRVKVNLTRDVGHGGRTWVEHPEFGPKVDVAAIDITECVKGLEIKCANEIESDAQLDSYPSQDAFVVGYPLGLIAPAPIPVWKRATIATDPAYEPEDLPKIFVDTATRQGMSGSVVIVRHTIIGTAYKRKDGTQSDIMIYSSLSTVLGIYSGRIGRGNMEAQLGIVWKRSLIDEVVAAALV